MSMWKESATRRRDFRHTKVDVAPRHMRKIKAKPWKLLVIPSDYPQARISQRYETEKAVFQALEDFKRKNNDNNFVLKYKEFQIWFKDKLVKKGEF